MRAGGLRALLGIGAIAALALAGAIRPATAAEPVAPTLVAPVGGAVDVRAGDPLSARVGPDSADVTFRWRRVGAGAPNTSADFTWVVLPDPQNYVASGRGAIVRAQTTWIADHAADLNVALVSQVGDLVDDPASRPQYEGISAALATLDDAGIANTVLPGNHDMVVATGEAALYRQFFPVSRYAGATWNSPTVRYGGYYGQDQFGDDPGDRANMDSYVLLRAGGMDLLVLNLEFNPPDDVLAWAQRVIDAYPDRRVMLATHNFLAPEGGPAVTLQRPGGNDASQLWSKLISPNCRIVMVVNGHNHGEGRRTMRNSCGRPVQVALTNYQDLPGGGDGYLRYYTFRPSTGTIEAYTWSPTLGRFQTDDDSRFDLPMDMSTEPAPAVDIGTVHGDPGEVVSVPVPALEPGATYEWSAQTTGPDGVARSETRRFTAYDPDRRTVVRDEFERDLVNGWGSPAKGGPWSQLTLPSRFSVSQGAGRLALAASTTTTALAEAVSSSSTRVDAVFSVDRLVEASYVSLVGRRVGSAEYYARLRLQADGGLRLNVLRNPGTALIGSTLQVPGAAVVPGQRYRLAFEVVGTSPTSLRAKVWKVGDVEPGWQRTGTDATAGLQAAGSVGVWGYLPSNAGAAAPMTLSFDSVTAVPTP